MADAERAQGETDGASPQPKRRDELDQLLQKIAAHITHVDAADPSSPVAPPGETQPDATRHTEGRDERDRPKAADTGDALPTAPTAGASLRRAPAVEPPALRSAVRAQPTAAPTPAEKPRLERRRRSDETQGPAPDPERRVAGSAQADQDALPKGKDATPVSPGEEPAWDAAAAEALTRTYEADAALPPLRSMLHAMASPPGSAGRHVAPAGDDRADDSETRLLDAARRVEAMLDTLARRETVEALGLRFDRIERKVDHTAQEVGRLDGIEARLGDLSTKLSDDQIVALFGPLVPTAEDLTRFAEEAAGRAADRVLESHSHQMAVQAPAKPAEGDGSRQLKAMSELLGSFMDEQRRTDVGVQEALETLQLAMQHVLDRIEAGMPASDQPREGGQRELAPPPPPPPAPREESYFEAPRRMPGETQLVRGEEVYERQAAPLLAPELDETIPDARGYAEAARQAFATEHGEVGMPAAPQSTLLHPQAAAARESVEHQREPSFAPPAPPAPPKSERQQFIEMARRAAEKANGGGQSQAPARAERNKERSARGTASPAAAPAPAPTPANGAAASSSVAALVKGMGGIRPGVLIVTSLAAFLLAGYWFLSGPKLGLPRAALPAATERVEAPQGPTAPRGAQPDVEPDTAPGAAQPAPAPSGGEQQQPGAKRTSDDGQGEVPKVDLQQASVDLAPSQAAGPGTALTIGSGASTPEQLMQYRERMRMAALSQRAGYSAARSQAVPPGTTFIETSSVTPSQAAAQPASGAGQQPASAPNASARQLTLPPAATGPLSLRLAAAQGDPSAQLEIATRLAEGKGVKQSFAEAAVWYERSAQQGEPIAQYRLATLYERGMGVKADRERAKAWYQQAADNGNLKAMHNLAVINANVPNGTPDYAAAAALFGKAAAFGLADSQYNLGVLYESGLGVPKDHAAAYKWYTLAANGGDQDAARRRDQLISRLPPQTLQAADEQVAAFRPAQASERANNARVAGESWKQRADARS